MVYRSIVSEQCSLRLCCCLMASGVLSYAHYTTITESCAFTRLGKRTVQHLEVLWCQKSTWYESYSLKMTDPHIAIPWYFIAISLHRQVFLTNRLPPHGPSLPSPLVYLLSTLSPLLSPPLPYNEGVESGIDNDDDCIKSALFTNHRIKMLVTLIAKRNRKNSTSQKTC